MHRPSVVALHFKLAAVVMPGLSSFRRGPKVNLLEVLSAVRLRQHFLQNSRKGHND